MYDIFICYSDEDLTIAEDLCNFLESQNLNCWLKKRDFKEEDTVSSISETIRDSKSVILIYSKNAKKSNYVTTEVDIAFSSNVPIYVFKIDETEIEGKLHFYLKDKPSVNAYPNPEDYYQKVLKDMLNIVKRSVKNIDKKDNEVYLCYSDDDILTAQAICHVLEENGIKCWFKSRDLSAEDTVQKISESIRTSKCIVLIYSQKAQQSNFVETDLNIAASSGIPIISFNIDESFANNKELDVVHWLDAYPNPENNFGNLTVEVSKILKKPITNPIISNDYENVTEASTHINPKLSNNTYKKIKVDDSSSFSRNYGIGKNFKKIIIALVIIGLIAFGLYYLASNTPLDSNQYIQSSDKGMSLGEYETSGIPNTLEMAIISTDFDEKYTYLMGKVYEIPDNFDEYTVKCEYYDTSGKLVDTSNVKIKDVNKEGDEYELVDYDSDTKIKKLKMIIYDENQKQVYETVIEDSD